MSTLGGIGFRPFDVATAARTVLTALSWPQGLMTNAGALVADTVPVQLDTLKRWNDGSIRHALAALRVPSLPLGQWASGGIEPAPALTGTPPPLTTDVVFRLTPAGGAPITIDLQTALNSATLDSWRTGPLVTESRVTIPVPELSPDFEIVADIAIFSDDTPTRVDLGFSRSLVDVGTGRAVITPNLVYDVTIAGEGQTASYSLNGCAFIADTESATATATLVGALAGTPTFNVPLTTMNADGYNLQPETQLVSLAGNVFTLSQARYTGRFSFSMGGPTHALGQTWHHTVNEQPVHVVHDVDMLRRAGVMIHRRDLGVLGMPPPVWPSNNPLSPNGITQYFPSTGDRPEIGAIPEEVIRWMISQDPAAYLNAMDKTRSFSAIPWHLRDRVTGKWISATDFPNLHPLQISQANNWSIDTAHAGCYPAIPWMLTGRRMWLDDLEAQAAATQSTAVDDRGNRSIVVSFPTSNPAGLPYTISNGQVRAQAWSLRTLGVAAAFVPDSRYLAAPLATIVAGNVRAMSDWLAWASFQGDLAIVQGAPATSTPYNANAPWQEDYFTIVLCWMNRLGIAGLGDILKAKANFLSGPFRGVGFPPTQGAPYNMTLYDATGTFTATWPNAWTAMQQSPEFGGVLPDLTISGDKTYWSLRYGSCQMLRKEILDTGAAAAVEWMDAHSSAPSLAFITDPGRLSIFKFSQLA